MNTPNPNRALWEKGDFTRTAGVLGVDIASDLVASRRGTRVTSSTVIPATFLRVTVQV